jgi:hypothetical protein
MITAFKTDKELRMIEKENTFWSPFSDTLEHNRKTFSIVKECDHIETEEDGEDISFIIKLETGEDIAAYLEEINGDYRYGRASYVGTLFPESISE